MDLGSGIAGLASNYAERLVGLRVTSRVGRVTEALVERANCWLIEMKNTKEKYCLISVS